ncbi:DUF4832 domain-containing protein [Butyrivibrio sp. VCB2006]|uniref:DUF4832 domain-containing protein n=1 Tax=Butyrivibrio sp. VCB2006 TaxID=1280679 RepID=UPI00040DB82F|nr:DUF4832 domain-containing protein [Butyrivibrio sp. VCB2006]
MNDRNKSGFIFFLIFAMILGAGIRGYQMYIRNLTGTTYKYNEGTECITNSYIGYAPSATSESLCEKSTLVYCEVTWAEIEPEEGVFNWDHYDSTHHMKRWRDEGKTVVLRFVCDKPGKEEHMDIPQWLYDKTGDGQFYDISYGKGYCPEYNNEIFIQEHERVIKEVARHFKEKAFVSYVELGSLGHWGEWHTYYTAGLPRMPETTVRAKYVKHYTDNFTFCRLLMRRPFAELPDGAGVFNDMTGISHDTSTWLGWISEGGDYNETGEKGALVAVPEIWNKAPVGGEFASSVPISTMLGENYDETVSLLKQSHMSFIGPMVPYVKRESLEFYESADSLLKYVGYRYRVKELNIRKSLGRDTAELTVTITNDGVCPIYFDCVPCLYVELPEGSDISFEGKEGVRAQEGTEAEGMMVYRLNIDLKSMLTGQQAQAIVNIPRDVLKCKGARIYAGIEESLFGEPSIKFDMEAERKRDLSLLWEKE